MPNARNKDAKEVISELGRQEAIVELFHAMQDVGRRWP